MSTVSEFDLLSGQPFRIAGIGTFRAPKLSDFYPLFGIGLEKYNMMLSLLSMGAEDFIRGVGLEEKYSALPPEEREQFTTFLLMTMIPDYRALLCEALDFFMLESVSFSEDDHMFVLTDDSGAVCGVIDEGNYDELRTVLMKANCMSVDSILAPKKFKNKRAKAVFEKIMAARQKKEASAPDDSLAIWNVISSVAAKHSSYNLLNIWDLTVYQLYDQFSKLNLNHQIDVSALRWAAWGQDPFDFSLWYKHEKQGGKQ